MPAKKPVRSNTPAKPATPEPSRPEPAQAAPAAAGGSRRAGVFALVAVVVIVVAIVTAVRNGSEPVEVAAADAKVAAAASNAAPAAVTAPKAKTPPKTAAPESHAAVPSTVLSGAVTISGCLERSEDGFRLKNTSGADAPKSRSWKTGFFKKSPASIDVVDAAHGLKLANYVGSRVNVTGALIDREMRAQSLQRVAGACK